MRWREQFVQEKAQVKRKAKLRVIPTKRNLEGIAKHPCAVMALLCEIRKCDARGEREQDA